MEDFGYQKEAPSGNSSQFFKKMVLLLVALLSISGFIYFTVSAYRSLKGGEKVETIKSPPLPVKVVEDNYGVEDEAGETGSRQIYEDIFGSKKNVAKNENPKVRNIQEPVNPPQEFVAEKKSAESAKTSPNSKNSKASSAVVSNQILEPKKEMAAVEKNNLNTLPNKASSKELPIKNSQEIKQNIDSKNDSEKPNLKSNNLAKESAKESAANIAKKMVATNEFQDKADPKEIRGESAKSSVKKRAIRVQVSAMSSQDLAEDNWQKISRENPSIFNNLKHFIVKADLGKRGIFYRLQIGEFYNQVAAEDFCSKFVSKAQKTRADCIIVE